MTPRSPAVEAFARSEAAPPRQRRLAAIVVLLATLAVAALAVLLVREAQNAQRLAALRQERDGYVLKLAEQIRANVALAAARDAPASTVREARVESTLLADRLVKVASAPSADAGAVQAPAATRTEAVQQLTLGAPTGWDVDLFWCAGPGADANYATASAAASALGSAASARQAVAPGVRIGRVRLRPVRAQDRGAWPDGAYAVPDGGRGEQEAAGAVAAYLSRATSIRFGVRGDPNPGAVTKWYLSVLACGR